MELLHKKLQRIKFDFTKELECPICLELLTDPVVTKCNHQFCRECLRNVTEERRIKKCPLCNEVLSKRSMVESATLKPLVRDLKLLLAAVDSDFEKVQDIKVASELLPTVANTPIRDAVRASKSVKIQPEKNTGQLIEAIGKAPTLLTQLSDEYKKKSYQNTVDADVSAVVKATAEYDKTSHSPIENEGHEKPKKNSPDNKESAAENLEAQQSKLGPHREEEKDDDKSQDSDVEYRDHDANTSSQSTVELILENKPPVADIPSASVCAASKVKNWLMNRCIQDPDSPVPLNSNTSKQGHDAVRNIVKNKIPGKIFKSRVIVNGNKCIASQNKGHSESDDPYKFISSQKVYPKKARKRQTRQKKRKSEESYSKRVGSKFADLIHIREKKIRVAKEKAMQVTLENAENDQELQSQPFPSSYLVNIHDKFDEFMLNNANNKQICNPPAKGPGPSEFWNDNEESNVFLTPAYVSTSPKQEKENLIERQEKTRKRKSRSCDRKSSKCNETINNTLNLLRSEIIDAERHELFIEVPKSKLRSRLSSKNPNVPSTMQNASLFSPRENVRRKTNVKAPTVSKGKAATVTGVKVCEDDQLPDIQATSVDDTTCENISKLLNAVRCEQKQIPEIMAVPLVSPARKLKVAPPRVDGKRGETPALKTCKNASVQLVQTSSKENELPLMVQMPEENKDSQIANLQKSLTPTSVNVGKADDTNHPNIVDDHPFEPRLDAQELLHVHNGAEKQLPNTNEELANALAVQNIAMQTHKEEIMDITIDNQLASLQNNLSSVESSTRKIGQKQDPKTVTVQNLIVPRVGMQECVNVQESVESRAISEEYLKSAEPLDIDAQIHKEKIPRTNMDLQTATDLDLEEPGKKQTLDFVGEKLPSVGRKSEDELSTPFTKDISIPKRLAENEQKAINEDEIDEEFSEVWGEVMVASRVSYGKVQRQYFGLNHGKPLFPFIKLGSLFRTQVFLQHSVSCQTEHRDQDYRSFGIKCEIDSLGLTNISSSRIRHSVECQTVPEETLPVNCQHCLSNVESKPLGTINVTDSCKKNATPLNSLEAKISDTQGDIESIIPPSQYTPYLDAELIGLYEMESRKNVLEMQSVPVTEMRIEQQNNLEIAATGSFDVKPLVPLSEIDAGHSLDILAPETCTQDCCDRRTGAVATSKFEDDMVPESDICICISKIKEIQEESMMINSEITDVIDDNADDITSSQAFTEDDVVPPTPPSEKPLGVWKRSPGITPSGTALIASQKRKYSQAKMVNPANKKAKTEEVSRNAKAQDFNKDAKELRLPGYKSFHSNGDDVLMVKVLANINLDLDRSTLVEDEDEIIMLEATENMKTIGHVPNTPESMLMKGALDTDFSEDMFGVDFKEFEKPYLYSQKNSKNIAKAALSENSQVQAPASTLSNNLPECDPLELTEKDNFLTNEELAMENGFSQNDNESLDWKDFETEEDFCEAFLKNDEENNTAVAGAPHSEQSTVSTMIATFSTTQQREILKKDIENDKQQLKEIEMLLAKKQHRDEKNEETKLELKAKQINTFEFDSDDGLEECLMDDDDSVCVPQLKTERAGAQIASRDNYSWDPDFGSWDSQDKAVKQKKQPQILQKRLPKVDTSPTTTTSPKASAPKYSFVVSGSSVLEQNNVQLLATRLKGSFLSNFDDTTTHVIVKLVGNLCERTLKYILGVSAGRWIVSYKWVTDSLKAGKAMPEANYEVVGDTNEGLHHGPRKARTNLDKPLLANYEICLVRPFTELTEDQLKLMLHYCGATYIPEPESFSKANTKQLVICESQFHLRDEFPGLLQRNKVMAVVSWAWLLDSIACYTIKPTKPYTLR